MRFVSWQLIISVIGWWVLSLLTTRVTERWIGVDHSRTVRGLEKTALQLLFGTGLSIFLLKSHSGQAVWYDNGSESHTKYVWIATVSHVVGSLATNAVYCLESYFGPVTQIIRFCEPLFTVLFSLVPYKQEKFITFPVMSCVYILLMILISCTFALYDMPHFNYRWNLVAVILSTIALPLRNVYLKRIIDTCKVKNPLQMYVIVSYYGMFIILPVVCIKFAITQSFFSASIKEITISFLSHFACNVASFSVLQNVSLLTHAILNLLRLVLTNIMYFHIPMTFYDVLKVLALGCFLVMYILRSRFSSRLVEWTSMIVIFFVAIVIPFKDLLWEEFGPRTHIHPNTIPVQHEHLLHVRSFSNQHTPSSIIGNDNFFTVWIYERPLPNSVVNNIKDFQLRTHHDGGTHFCVYCGSSQCMQTVMEMNDKNITAEFLVVTDIVKDTPLEKWMARHPLYKVLAGVEYEDHLQEVAKLGILWHYGGTYVEPTLKFNKTFSFPKYQQCWVSKKSSKSEQNIILDVSFFPEPHHPFIGMLAENFVAEYPKARKNNRPTHFDFQKLYGKASAAFCLKDPDHCPHYVEIQFDRIHLPKSYEHFGTLLYNNITLEGVFQSFAEMQFFPFVDRLFRSGTSGSNEQITTFLSGLWENSARDCPPQDHIHPLTISFHIQPNHEEISEECHDYLKENEPIGCTDHSTLRLLSDHGIESYYTGDTALLMRKPYVNRNPTSNKKYAIVDVMDAHKSLIPIHIQHSAVVVEYDINGYSSDVIGGYAEASKRLETYVSAKVVITQDVRCALFCVAMGTPVIFINSTESNDNQLLSLFHTLHLTNSAPEETKHWLHEFPWDNPPSNPNVAMMMRLRATLWNVIRNNQQLYDASYKFGIVPFSVPTLKQEQNHKLVFHLLFTTSSNSTLKLWGRKTFVQGMFNWRHLRSVESIFYHHPLAKVIIHSNTLDQSEFDLLTEVGYDIKVQRYSLEQMLKDTPAQNFSAKLEEAQKSVHWYSHETDLIRMLLLYKWGGVYMDTDVIVVRPLDTLVNNVLGWQDPKTLNGAFLMFEKHNAFIKACLEEFTVNYNADDWPANGPFLLTRIWKKQFRESEDVHVLERNVFYMFRASYVKPRCFKKPSNFIFDYYMTILKEEAYAVHLNSKITATEGSTTGKLIDGTICKHLLNSFCVLCNKQY